MYPEFIFGETFIWTTTVTMEAFAGFQKFRGRNERTDPPAICNGECEITLQGEIDESVEPSEEGKRKINWLIENQHDVVSSALDALFKEYESIRDEYGEYYREDTGLELPDIDAPEELKQLVGDIEIVVHRRVSGERPYIGILANCAWEREHGLGWLMLGNEVRIITDVQMAMADYVVDGDAKKIK